MEALYNRVLLKLSGEALGGDDSPVDFDAVAAVAKQVGALHRLGVQLGVVVGGGNIWRGRSSGKMDRNRADHMGMLATAINALALCDALEKEQVPCTVLSAVEMNRFCDAYTFRSAQTALQDEKVVIFACGTGSPFFSTDTAAALRAAEIHADALLLAKNVDAVYSADPKLDPSAVRYAHLSYDEVIQKNLHATDLTAITLCREVGIPILLFSMREERNILDVICGGDAGTRID